MDRAMHKYVHRIFIIGNCFWKQCLVNYGCYIKRSVMHKYVHRSLLETVFETVLSNLWLLHKKKCYVTLENYVMKSFLMESY